MNTCRLAYLHFCSPADKGGQLLRLPSPRRKLHQLASIRNLRYQSATNPGMVAGVGSIREGHGTPRNSRVPETL